MSASPSIHPALGIDYGDARIGIAATDPMGILAHPVETIHIKQTDPIGRIREIVSEKGIHTLVLGLPLTLDGNEGSAAEKVRKFAQRLTTALPGIPLVWIDETYTTVAASEKLREAGKKAKKQKDIIDQAAAVEILRIWLYEDREDVDLPGK